MAYATVSIKEARSRFAELIERVSVGQEVVAVTKFGKLKAVIAPPAVLRKDGWISRDTILKNTFGMWKRRKDMANASQWVRRIRKKNSSRYGDLFG